MVAYLILPVIDCRRGHLSFAKRLLSFYQTNTRDRNAKVSGALAHYLSFLLLPFFFFSMIPCDYFPPMIIRAMCMPIACMQMVIVAMFLSEADEELGRQMGFEMISY